MPVSNDVQSNCFMRQWVKPAEAVVRQNAPMVPQPVPVEAWRRGAQKGANVGALVGSALMLPVDLFAGTLRGSARIQVEQAHLAANHGARPAPLPFKQRFLLRLEDGALGAIAMESSRGSAYLGQAVGGVLGATVGLAEWALRAAGAGLKLGPYPHLTRLVRQRAVGGANVGQSMAVFVVAVSIALSTLVLSLASAGAKGVCIGTGALMGGLVGLGGDLPRMWPQLQAQLPLVKTA